MLLRTSNRKGIFLLCLSIGLTAASCMGCSKNRDAQKPEEIAIKATEAAVAEPLEDLVVEAEVPTARQIDLTWNKISRATGYNIVRESYSLSSADVIRRKGDRKVLARLSSDETSYQDSTVRKGCYYIYRVRAHCEYDELDEAEYDPEDMPAVLKSEEAYVYTGVLSASWETTGYQNIAHDDPEACPDDITLPIRINRSTDIATGIGMTGVEIFRGTSFRNIRKWEDVPIVEEELEMILEEPALLYKDENVEAGETYYYQVRGYAEAGGERWHGKRSNYVKVSAVLPDGDYSMDLTEKKGMNPSFEISLQSNIIGNARLDFIRNEWNGRVDYVYQKEDSSYHSASMYLESYRKGTQKWTPYQRQELYLDGTENIRLRLAPLEGEKILWPEDGLKSAEIILWVNYNGCSAFLCFDLIEEKEFIIGIHSCSRGNPSLSFKYSDGTCETKDYTVDSADGFFSLAIKAYSTDGVHWKKRKGKSKGNVLSPKGTIYLKLVLRKGQAGMEYYDKDNIARINVYGSVEKEYPQGEVNLTYELESGKLSSIFLTSDD